MKMFIAIDKLGQIIDIEEAAKGGEYYCPECDSKLIVKDGEINIKHFAHEKNSDCDTWGEMSQWHLNWQSNFDKSVREVVLNKDGIKHRADIFISTKDINLTIEFQKSPISKVEIVKRNLFYNQFGKVLWVFDLTYKEVKIDYNKNYKNLHKYKWNHFSKSIPTPKEFAEMGVSFCFQLPNNEIVFPCGVENDNWKYFYSRKTDLVWLDKFLPKIKDDFFLKPYDLNDFIKIFVSPDEYRKQKLKENKQTNNYEDGRKFTYEYIMSELTPAQKECIEFGLNKPEDFAIRVKKYI
jgi:DNA-directed RNA polymerase subunit RPC12/RpoP